MYKNKVNELYYAKDNVPSFYQFKNKYHFYDDRDRQYMIATKNRQVFQNTRFKNTRPRSSSAPTVFEPYVNNYGLAKLYVKLADRLSPWFERKDVNKTLTLYDKSGRYGPFHVILESHHKSNEKRRTGSVMVGGLDKHTLVELLRQ